MIYDEARNFILGKQSLGIMPGLTRIINLLETMGNPQNDIKIIHIAGTNGKGTVAKTINNALINAENKVGLFSSPWIDDYREQIQINNVFISKEEFASYVDKYKDNDCTNILPTARWIMQLLSAEWAVKATARMLRSQTFLL